MKTLNIFIILIALSFLGYWTYQHQDDIRSFFYGEPTHIIQIKGARLFATLAITPEQRVRGLSGTSELPDLAAMLFVFDTADRHGIWMKDMQYPIDIFWLDGNFNIVHIEERVIPETYPKTFRPHEPARYVIETNAGIAEAFNIKEGDIVVVPDSTMKKILSN